ncbi:hypothetical protein UFOVP290_12 [uncultured Caudovirales phage]|uniref:Uncharacterized protein n=1 Tax=uncultured Caudovirales phage TaxID=2100421 RepID=A0A6J5RCP8_9CAUD|nr:hypothetical protein UFOVP290_12 [uncultured Caudovirales phage]CAB4176136.1 hypothetical protein UFOVP982_12 [uncultured Caudovirales phage]CAB4194809.1 hypothetical protein UFOVP1265_21 [uncultured Caudovirales phage]
MATSTYLSNPSLTVNAVDLSDQTTSATLTVKYDALESTAFGSTSRVYTAGLGDHELTVELFMSYAATETYATLAALVGTATTVVMKPTSSAVGATNPSFTLTGTYLESLPVIDAALGELSSITLTFRGGVYAAAVA